MSATGNSELELPTAREQQSALQTHIAIVAQLFAEAFQTDSVDPDDSFFELGGDSLIGAELMAAIEARFETGLSISVLLEAPTPTELARAILDERQSTIASTLITVQEQGTRPTVLCVPGQNGESFFPHRFSEATGPDVPVYAFRAVGLNEGEVPYTSVRAIASAYVGALDRSGVAGPYVVLGHCAGSIIAYEMAQQLSAADQGVVGLVLIDPTFDKEGAPYLHMSGLALSLFQHSWNSRAALLQQAIEENPKPDGKLRGSFTSSAVRLAIGTYTPEPYSGRALMFITPQRKKILLDRERGYPRLIEQLETADIDVKHDDMFEEQSLARIVERIGTFVDDVST